MSMTVQEPGTCSTIFQTISDQTANVAEWITKTVQAFGSTIADYAQKVAEYVKPQFEKISDFLSENRGPILVAAIAAAVGAALYAVISAVFCSNATPEQNPQPAPATTAATTTTA